ncbi:MAG: hypothetical protein K0S74_730 [Chlamydiales bacterium]|jgi:hypothetical protein|nr:hypothetical protein [Chlamydiales bacterium]
MAFSYYFLIPTLPSLQFNVEPSIPFKELIVWFRERLCKKDLDQLSALQRWLDLNNLRQFWKEGKIDPRGNFQTVEALQEALEYRKGFPEYVFEFIDRYQNDKTKVLQHFSELISTFFSQEIITHTGFLNRYFIFEREWRLVMLGLRAKQLGRDLAIELQYEDPTDPIVAQLLAQKDSANYDPPTSDPWLKKIITEQREEVTPKQLYIDLARYRFERIAEFLTPQDQFTLDHILCYAAQLIILEQWRELDQKQGALIAENILRKII